MEEQGSSLAQHGPDKAGMLTSAGLTSKLLSGSFHESPKFISIQEHNLCPPHYI